MVISKGNRVSSTGLDRRFFQTEINRYKQEISLPRYVNVLGSFNAEPPTQPDDVATLHSCFKPFWVAMRILGYFPITFTSTGVAVYSQGSAAFKYALLIFLLMGSCTTLTTLSRMSFIHEAVGNFNDLIFSYMCILYCTFYWCVPTGHWIGANKICAFINDWSQYQVRYETVTRGPLHFTLGRQLWSWSIAIPILATIELLFEYYMLDSLTICETVYYTYINIMIMYHYALWYYFCQVSSQAAERLRDMLTRDLRAHPSDQGVVPKYRALWQKLSTLASTSGDLLCYTYGSIVIISFSILTFSIYGFVSDLSLSQMNLKQIGLGFNCVVVFAYLFLLCNAAHLTSNAVGSDFLQHLKHLESHNAVVQHQIEQFQIAICLDPPHINLGGFVNIDRSLLISLLATIVTYLVVLLQFKAGVETEASIASNTTLKTTSP